MLPDPSSINNGIEAVETLLSRLTSPDTQMLISHLIDLKIKAHQAEIEAEIKTQVMAATAS